MLFQNSIKIKFITLLILIVTTVLTIFEIYSYFSEKDEITKELLDLSDRTINRLSENLIIPLWEVDNSWIKKIIDTEMSDKKIEAIFVHGEGYLFEGKKRDENGLIIESKNNLSGDFIVKKKDIFRNEIKIGQVKVYITKKYMNEELYKEAMSVFIHSILLSVSIIISLIYILNKIIISPLQNLLSVVKNISRGDYSKDIKIKQKDEIGILANSFNKMKSSIYLREEERNRAIAKLSEKEEYLREVLDSQPNIVVINDGTYLINTNRVFFQFFDKYKSISDFRKEHKCICDFFEYDESGEFLQKKINSKSWIEVLKENPKKIYKAKIKKDEKEYIFSVKLKEVYLKDGIQNIVTFSDITELENYHKLLETRVASEIEKRREQEVKMLEQAKLVQMGEMITAISHHWRQPLNLIGIVIQDIEDSYEMGELTEEYLHEQVETAMDALVNMSSTINAFKEITQKVDEKDKFNIANAINKTINLLKPGFESHFINLNIELNEELQAYGNYTHLMQALNNILINAEEALLEANPEEKNIKVILKKDNKNSATIDIIDNGGNINNEIMSRIFDPFFTTKETAYTTGTGLYFTKVFIEHDLGGKVNVKNYKDGVCFRITLPLFNE